jgi:choline dehydrogenase
MVFAPGLDLVTHQNDLEPTHMTARSTTTPRMPMPDVVVVGGGTSGSVLAARLSEDQHRQVVLLEAGPDDDAYPDIVRTPSREYEAIMECALGVQWHDRIGRASAETLFYRGEAMGGTSAVNFMATVRGQPADYDGWAALGCDGWGWEQVLAGFLRAEHDLDAHPGAGRDPGPGIAPELHGSGGPLTVRRWPEHTWSEVHRALYEGALELGASRVDDINDAAQLPGVGVFPGSVDPHTGERLSVSQAYLTPEERARPNLTIRCRTRVRRVLLRDDAVEGVELDDGGVLRAPEVVLCAGAIESPRLLLVSGIGPPDELADAGIAPVAALPGVGRGLQDHVGLGCLYSTPIHETLVGSPAKVVWIGDTGHDRAPDFHILVAPISSSPAGGTLFQLFAFHLQPRARGRLRLRPGDPHGQPLIELPFLDGEDLRDLSVVVDRVGQLERTDAFGSLGATRLTPADPIPPGIGPDDVARLLDHGTFTYFHQTGTCRMGSSDDPHAVLDAQLRVRGVRGLRVADASCMPGIVRGNTYLGCVMVAERLAELMSSG